MHAYYLISNNSEKTTFMLLSGLLRRFGEMNAIWDYLCQKWIFKGIIEVLIKSTSDGWKCNEPRANLTEHDASWNKTCFGSHIIHPVNWMVYFKARLHMRFLLKKPGSRSYKLGVISEKFSYDLSPRYGKGVLNFHRHLVQLQCDIKCCYNNRMCKRWTDRYTSSFRDTNVHLRKRVYINIDWLLYITLSFEPFCHSPLSL